MSFNQGNMRSRQGGLSNQSQFPSAGSGSQGGFGQQQDQSGFGQQSQGGFGQQQSQGGYGQQQSQGGFGQQSQGGYNSGGYDNTATSNVPSGGGYDAPQENTGPTKYGASYRSGLYGSSLSSDDAEGGAVMSLDGENRGSSQPFHLNSSLRYTFGLILLTSMFLHADQNLAAPSLTAIARDFRMTDAEKDSKLGGLVQFGFFLIGGFVSIFIGPLADKMDRATLLSLVVIAGSLPCLLTLWIPDSRSGFWFFFAARVTTGISIGGSFPVLYSLCGDLFPSSQRSFVAACVGASCNIGAALGGVMAGIVGPLYGWRVPFAVVAVPAIALAVLVKFTLKDPRAGKKSEVQTHEWVNAWAGGRSVDPNAINAGYINLEELDMSKFKDVGKIPVNKWLFLQAIPGCIPISVIVTFLSDYLTVQQRMDVKASTGITAVFGISCLIFSFQGGAIGQRLWNTNKNMFFNVLAICNFCAAFPFIALINLPFYQITTDYGKPTWLAYFLAALGGITAFAGPNIRAVFMNVNPSEIRGTVFSAFTLCDDLGKGFGPSIIVLLISAFGRRLAFTIAFLLWCVSSGLLYRAKFEMLGQSTTTKKRF